MSEYTALACPFCHSTDIEHQLDYDVSRVICLTCGASGPWVQDENNEACVKAAVAAWNSTGKRNIAKDLT